MATKKQGNFGIAYTGTPTGTAAAPHIILNCDDANITPKPILDDTPNNLTRDRLEPDAYGFDYDFNFSCPRISIHELGYLLWLFLGAQSGASTTHTLTRGAAALYAAVFLDGVMDLGSSTPTEVGLGAKIGSLDIEFLNRQKVKVSGSGKLCNLGSPVAALVPSISSAAVDAAVGWNHLRGGFMSAVGGGSLAADTAIRSLSIHLEQGLQATEPDLGSNVVGAINEDDLQVSFKFARAFSGAKALAEYANFLTQGAVGIAAVAAVSTHNLSLSILQGKQTAAYRGGIGGGADEIMATMECDAYATGAATAITASATDGVTGSYT